MKIIVLSDIHGDYFRAKEAVDKVKTAEVVIFTGDGERDIDRLEEIYPDIKFLKVRGNCDMGSNLPVADSITLEGKKIFYTHGHMYNVKYSEYDVREAARERKADIVLYGHTHIPVNEYKDDMWVMNPGSCHGYDASFGTIDIQNGQVLTNIIHLR
ncbi:MAG: metallophosphoesterase [Clostridia bacterium]|nr:metallophosphoesterase [Clostridia bacterium]